MDRSNSDLRPKPWVTDLEPSDWELFLECNWRHEFQKQIVLLLRERDNAPITRECIEDRLGQLEFGNNFMKSMRSAFRTCTKGSRSAYAIRYLEEHVLAPKRKLQIFKKAL